MGIFGLLFLVIYLVLLSYPVFGLAQIVDSFEAYLEDGRHPDFYKDIEKYALIVVLYILIAIIICTPTFSKLISHEFYIFYFLVLAIPIGLYNRAIMNKKYYEEIEKLIF